MKSNKDEGHLEDRGMMQDQEPQRSTKVLGLGEQNAEAGGIVT